jgi:HSP90 family molecular chaperone
MACCTSQAPVLIVVYDDMNTCQLCLSTQSQQAQTLRLTELKTVASCSTQHGSSPEGERTQLLARLLYDTALLESGFQLDDNKAFNKRVYSLVKVCASCRRLTFWPSYTP